MELLVAEAQPEHVPAEVRRRQPLQPEQLLVEAGRGLEVVGVDRDVVEASGTQRV
jgi:hypothetical protein